MNYRLTKSLPGLAMGLGIFYCSMLAPSQGFAQADTTKHATDTLKADSIPADTAKQKKPEDKGPKPFS